MSEWVRDLVDETGVVTFIASKEGPSEVIPAEGHGRFAAGILGAFETDLSAEVRPDPSADYSLEEFNEAPSVTFATGATVGRKSAVTSRCRSRSDRGSPGRSDSDTERP